jgi:predicted site-specific integrase-resolvase
MASNNKQMTNPIETPLLTRKQVAAFLSVHPDTVKNLERAGKLPIHSKLNGRPRYSQEAVKNLVSYETSASNG